jgi:hypothetical protein
MLILRISLGGAVWGGLFGVAVGSTTGAAFGIFDGDVSMGLDGALVGGGLGILLGALYGCAVAIQDNRGGEGGGTAAQVIDLAANESFAELPLPGRRTPPEEPARGAAPAPSPFSEVGSVRR